MVEQLEVVVNPELTIDAGWWKVAEDEAGDILRIIHPPAKTMYRQLFEYLANHDEQSPRTADFCSWRKQAVALTNLCLRWGSYFAVLADRNKTVYPKARGESYHVTSHISDGEMARINIEVSAALAYWLDLHQTDRQRYMVLIERSLELLPATNKSIRGWPENMIFQRAGRWIIDRPDEIEAIREEWPERVIAADQFPTRVFANALIHYSWRNGSGVEDIHAGQFGGAPLLRRRIRASDERRLFRETAKRMEEGLFTMYLLENAPGDWSYKVSPFNMVPFLSPPNYWSVTEETCEFNLFGNEPD